MKNKLLDLNNHLFAQLERLTDEDLDKEKLPQEINRSKAVSNLAAQIIGNAKLALQAQCQVNEWMVKNPPKMLGVDAYEEREFKENV